MQKECATKVFGDKLTFGTPKSFSGLTMTSSIREFSYVLKNSGLLGQTTSVSFDLDVTVTNNLGTLHSESFRIDDYFLDEAVFKTYLEIILAPWWTASGKADKFAFTAFITTTKLVCEKYRDALLSAQN